MKSNEQRMRASAIVAALAVMTAACGDDDRRGSGAGGGDASTGAGAADQIAGDTVIVTIVNPVVNDAHNTGVPDSLGTERDGIDVDSVPGTSDVTAGDGIGVLDVEAGPVELSVGVAPALSHDVVAEGDLYDAPLAYDGDTAAFFDNTPIRYAVGQDSGAVFFGVDDDFGEIEGALSEDDSVVVLGSGTYVGSLNITGERVLLFGEGWSERAVLIDGSIVAAGNGVRLRGLTITGDLTANGNTFGISFSVVEGSTDIRGQAGAFVRNVFCGSATVPSSNATLLDNWGVAPLDAPADDVCP